MLDALFERCHRLGGHLAFDLAAWACPEAIAQEFAAEDVGDRAFGLVDRQVQLALEPLKQRHHPFACHPDANVNVRIIGIAHKSANRALGQQEKSAYYKVELVSAQGGGIESSSGVAVETRPITDLWPGEALTVLVAGFSGAEERR